MPRPTSTCPRCGETIPPGQKWAHAAVCKPRQDAA